MYVISQHLSSTILSLDLRPLKATSRTTHNQLVAVHENMEQPDFQILSQSIATVSNQISLLPNLPALNQDGTLITKVEGLETTIQEMLAEMRHGFTSMG